ncbi:hypothetical protein Tco_1023758, partial [Tanacetum coccineum]
QEANQNAGTEDIIDAGDFEKEDESDQDCFVLPIWPSYSSTTPALKSNNKREGPREEEQVFMDELERLKKQENEANEEAETLRKKFETLVIQEGADKTSIPPGESSVQRDPLVDEIPEDTVDHMGTENAQDEGRTRDIVDEHKEIEENILSTEEAVSTDKEKVSTDRPIVSTDGSKVSTDRQNEGTEEHIEGTEEQVEGTKEHIEGTEEQVEGTEEQVESTDGHKKGTEEEIATQTT